MDETDTVTEKYVEAAAALVAGGGWDALSFDGLVTALGASRSTIHDRFSKAEWKPKLVERAFAMLLVEIVAQLKTGRSLTWSDAEAITAPSMGVC